MNEVLYYNNLLLYYKTWVYNILYRGLLHTLTVTFIYSHSPTTHGMSAKGGARIRQVYMRMLLDLIPKDGITLEKLEALAGWKIGLSPRRVKEYIKQFRLAGLVEEKDGKFYKV